MPEPGGYAGAFLFVDLTRGKMERKPLNWDYARAFIGGSGYAVRLLYDCLPLEDLDPLSPANEVAIFTGPLTATGAPCTGRHAVCTKSALTGIWGESTSGGYFGAELKKAGLDGILITGAASAPMFLELEDGHAALKPADHIWGKSTAETQQILRRDAGDEKLRVLSIGPAGENLVRFAAVMNDEGRAAARAGAGAVLGSKKLKAITVRGTGKPQVSDSGRFTTAIRSMFKAFKMLAPILGEQGTLGSADMLMNLFGDMPVRYFTEAQMSVESINAIALKQFRSGRFRCHLCPIGCGPIITLNTGRVDLKDVAGPEYETVAAFGTLCQVDDLPSLIEANHLCNMYGLDTISCGSSIAFAFAAAEQGKIPEELSVGLVLRFGEAETLLRLVEMIARRQGLGDLLAEGVRHASERLGIQELALHVKGLEVPMHDPRAFFGMATTYATSPIGASHMHGDVYTVSMGIGVEELGIEPDDRHTDEGKGITVAKLQAWRALFNSLPLCQLTMPEPSLVAELYSAATGWTLTLNQLFEIGRRTITLKRAFNIRCGVTAKDDTLPSLLLKPLNSGPNAGRTPNLEVQLKEYYEFNGWDSETGKPTRETLQSLGLGEVADDLWPGE